MSSNFKQLIRSLPQKPGVYRYYSADGELLYVGKAKNLKNRVSQYFQNTIHHPRIRLMVSQIAKIEYTVCATEQESLLLEANLINSLQPKYNIALKEDRNYCYIKFASCEPIPGFFVTRDKNDPKSEYFGPFANRFVAELILRTLRSIFPFCQVKKPQTRPCSYVGIGLCEGICCGQEDMISYQEKIEQLQKALQGKLTEVEKFLLEKINLMVDNGNFAQATVWKDRLLLLRKVLTNRKTLLSGRQSVDLVTLVITQNAYQDYLGSVFVEQIVEGKVVNVGNYLLLGSELDLEPEVDLQTNLQDLATKFLARFLVNFYAFKKAQSPLLVQVFYVESIIQ